MTDNVIPPITDPLGKSWKQPDPASMMIDDTHALMSKRAFWELLNYSTSRPSGVYPGKMWRAHVPINPGVEGLNGPYKWVLRWYGIVPGNDKVCSNNQRDILVDGGIPDDA